MFKAVISFSLNNKIIVFLLVFILIAAGIFSFKGLPVDAVPDITNNQVQVVTVAPDLATTEVERFISFPVEQALTNIPGKSELRSLSRFGLSVVTIVFSDETDLYLARQQIAERLNEIRDQIPARMGTPGMMPVTTGLGEIFQYTLRTKPGFEAQFPLTELRTVQDWIVRRQLLGTPGVADISSFGGHLKQYEVAVHPQQLKAMGISIESIYKALEQNNQNAGGAYIEKEGGIWYIRSEGLVNSADEIAQIEVERTPAGIPMLIRDLAEVRIGKAIRYGAITRDTSGETVGGVVLMIKGENSSAVIEKVKSKMRSIEKSLPEGLEVVPYLDRTKLVNNAIDTIKKNLTEGALIVIFVLVILLGNLRAGLIVASVIPLSLLFAICMMRIFGVSGNLMSLGAIDFGLIVDGAVIIVEGVVHAMQMSHFTGVISRDKLQQTVNDTSGRMIRFATFGQLIILIVYLPILTLTGIEGKMFKPMAETVSFAIVGALLLSMTWVPVASTLLLNRKIQTKRNLGDNIMEAVRKMYLPALKNVLNKPRLSLTIGLLLLLLSLFVFSRLGGEFIPVLEEGDFAVEMRLLPGSSISHTIETTEKAASILMKRFPEITAVTGKIGTSEIPTDPMPPEACDLIISLKDKDQWVSASNREDLAEKMQTALEEIPGVNFGFQQPIQMRFNELMTGARQDIVVKIFGEDLDSLTAIAGKIAGIAGSIEGAADIYQEKLTGLPQKVISIKRDRLARYGISVEQVNRAVNMAFAGQVAGQVFEGERRFDLVVRLTEERRKDLNSINEITIPDKTGNLIPLEELADIQTRSGPVVIQRDDARRRAMVGFNARGRDVESIVNELIENTNQQLKLPAGYTIEFGGQFRNLAEARERLMIAVPVALLLIFILLYLTFGSVKYALLIFSAVPFSIIGGVFALWLRSMPFSISAGVGFIALSGVAVLNGIVLIGMFNQLKKNDMKDLYSIIIQGAAERIRPILMTAAVASLGFMPMAISNSPGAEVQKPLATVVIGGLISATLLTLFLLPVLYMLFERIRIGKSKAAALLMIVFLSFTGDRLTGQTTRYLSLEEAVQLALQQHPGIRQSEQILLARKARKGAAFDPGPMNVLVTGGQYNSIYRDRNFNFSQTIPFPMNTIRQAAFNKNETAEAETGLLITKKEITLLVSQAWQKLSLLQKKQQVFYQQDSLFAKAEKIALLRVGAGETNRIEMLGVQSARAAARTELNRLQHEITATENSLRLLTGLDTPLSVTRDTSAMLLKTPLTANVNSWENAPSYKLAMQRAQTAGAQVRLEKSMYYPGLMAGYFNQSLTGFQNINGTETFYNSRDRFTGYQAGLSFPLVFTARNAKVKSARHLEKAAEDAVIATSLQLKDQLQQLKTQMQSALQNISYLNDTVLPQADQALKAAVVSWEAGNTGYLELVFLIRQVNELKRSQLDELERYNNAVLQYEFLFQ